MDLGRCGEDGIVILARRLAQIAENDPQRLSRPARPIDPGRRARGIAPVPCSRGYARAAGPWIDYLRLNGIQRSVWRTRTGARRGSCVSWWYPAVSHTLHRVVPKRARRAGRMRAAMMSYDDAAARFSHRQARSLRGSCTRTHLDVWGDSGGERGFAARRTWSG